MASEPYTAELPPGEYRMVVNVGVDLPPGYKEGDALPPPKIVLPDQYTTRANSTLTAEITPDRSEPLNIELQ